MRRRRKRSRASPFFVVVAGLLPADDAGRAAEHAPDGCGLHRARADPCSGLDRGRPHSEVIDPSEPVAWPKDSGADSGFTTYMPASRSVSGAVTAALEACRTRREAGVELVGLLLAPNSPAWLL